MIRLALKNIDHKRFKYVMIFFVIMVFSVSLFCETFFSKSLTNGLEQAKMRLGADIIVVPKGESSTAEQTLFNGKPCTLTFPAKFSKEISHFSDIKSACSETYIATLPGASCCDGQTQLIAFDPKNDFIVGAWINESVANLKDNEIVLGSNYALNVGDTVKYYNKHFTVRAKLTQTGLGYDQSAFITYGAAQDIVKNNPDKFSFSNVHDVSSMAFLRLNDPDRINDVKQIIEQNFLDVSSYTTNNKMHTISRELNNLSIFGRLGKVAVTILTALSLFSILTLTTIPRKNEIGTYLTIGIPKNKIIGIFFLEYLIVSLVSILCSFFGTTTFFLLFSEQILSTFQLPAVSLSIKEILNLFLRIIGMNLLLSILSILFPFVWIKQSEPATLTKEIGA